VTDAVDEVVHAVQVAQERGLAATGRPDEGDDLTLGDIEGDGVEGLLLSVVETEIADADVVLAAFAFGGGADFDAGRRRRIHDLGHEWFYF
jgi:hypothetical protein